MNKASSPSAKVHGSTRWNYVGAHCHSSVAWPTKVLGDLSRRRQLQQLAGCLVHEVRPTGPVDEPSGVCLLQRCLSTTRKHDIAALDALTDLFNGNPWMPPTPST